ncbi:uncharacterized protein LOC134844058 isoform X2 [Symsagittifera roscoffensis]|uniref:uncharacterized protein LOC134844058 isoform X2 n=1 Tax=Symsagittifera roscoffensis TaxID=84072 RepID=UPI00307B2143
MASSEMLVHDGRKFTAVILIICCLQKSLVLADSQPKTSATLDASLSSAKGEHIVPLGRKYTLECATVTPTDELPRPDIRWQINGSDIEDNRGSFNEPKWTLDPTMENRGEGMTKYSCKLILHEFTAQLKGVYGCYIRNSVSPRVKQFSLRPTSFDAVCGNAESIRISLGSPVSIPCPLKDLSGSDVTIDSRKWCINNCDSNLNVKAESSDPSPFRSADSSRLRVVGDTLEISEISLDEVGTWECRMSFFNPDTAQNDYRSCTSKLIHIPKMIRTSPAGADSFLVSTGDRFSFTCQAEAVPTAEVLWFSYSRDPRGNDAEGQPVSSDFDDSGFEVSSPNNSPTRNNQQTKSTPRYTITRDKSEMSTTLRIDPVEKGDQKYFACQFRTSSGVAKKVFKLSVKGKYSWVFPLLAIAIEIFLLSGAILLHEYRQNQRAEQRHLLPTTTSTNTNAAAISSASKRNQPQSLYAQPTPQNNRPANLPMAGSVPRGGVAILCHSVPSTTMTHHRTMSTSGGTGSTPNRSPKWTPKNNASPSESLFSSKNSNPQRPSLRKGFHQQIKPRPRASNTSLVRQSTGESSRSSSEPLYDLPDSLPPPPILPKPVPIPIPSKSSQTDSSPSPKMVIPMKPGICFPVPQSAFVPPYPSPPPLQELSALSRTGSLQRQDALSDETTWLTSEDNEDVDVVYIQC